jgi:hypothetical protein
MTSPKPFSRPQYHPANYGGAVYRPSPVQPILYAICFLLTLAAMVIEYSGGYEIALIVLFFVTLLVSFLCENRNIFQICLVGSHYTFWVMPLLVLYANNIETHLMPMAGCLLCVIIGMYLVRGETRSSYMSNYYNINISTPIFLLIILFALSVIVGSSGAYMTFVAVFLIVSYALYIDRKSFSRALIAYLAVIGCIMVYAYFFWSGTGRLIVFGYILMTTLIFVRGQRYASLGKWAIFILMGFGGLI